ncbi:hypothetical protein Q8F55_001593 [Vanrija albida]|uniref:Uncharacterized protein n=1 Tax=Vanrija albida TaxID=181172 RepID=A0ABR3QGF0_9TREE
MSRPFALGLSSLRALRTPAAGARPLLRLQPRALHTTPRARAPNSSPQSPLVPRNYAGGSGSSGGSSGPRPSAYGVWYREIFPAMIPIFVLSTTIFLALSLVRTHLSHSRSLAESSERIAQLEAQLARLRAESKRRQERERRERERILPIVVERVLQRVGAMGPEEEIEVEEERLLV